MNDEKLSHLSFGLVWPKQKINISAEDITLGSSNPSKLWNSFRGIMKAAKLAVYKAKNTTANKAQIADINLKLNFHRKKAILGIE